MGFIGGDIVEITYNHSEIGSGSILCKANEDGTIDLGGFRSSDDANQITGDGRLIDQINRVRGSFESPPIAWDMTGEDELQKLADMAASPILGNWTITSISGAIFGGRGKPVGDLQAATNTSLITLKLAFENKIKRIS
jgi:hypothetical protein